MARDLILTLSDSVLAAISGYDASTDKEMFNNYATLSAMTRTTDNWMHGLSGSTGIPALNNRTLGGYVDGTFLGGALVTPRHAVFALHASAQVGNIFHFWDRDNNTYTRTVSGAASTGLGTQYGDFMVVTFDSDLPAAIEPLPIFPSDLHKYVAPNNFIISSTYATLSDALIVSTDQEEKSLVHRMSYINFRQFDDDFPNDYDTAGNASAGYTNPVDADALLWRESMIPGDSGSPMMAIVDNQLIFLGAVSTTSDFDFFGNLRNVNDLNKLIVDADADAGVSTGYTATEFNLSGAGITNYSPPIYYPPALALSAASVAVFEEGFSPEYDITWSFTYELSNFTEDDEFGCCLFLQDADVDFAGGGVGIDLGYSGSYDNGTDGEPLSGAILGVGFDTLGSFVLPIPDYGTGSTRDGLSSIATPNGVAVRDGDYNLLTTTSISAYDMLTTGKKTLRARLGDYGRKLVVDYKLEGQEFFTRVLEQDVDLTFTSATRYRPGVSIVKPLSSDNTNGDIVVTGFHVEGHQDSITEEEFAFTPMVPFTNNTTVLGPVPQPPPDSEDRPTLPFLGMEPHVGCAYTNCDLPVAGTEFTTFTYPTTFLYGMSAFIGDVEVNWSTSGTPHRFLFNYDVNNVIDTGFVGSEAYNYSGSSRSTFIAGILSSANHSSYPTTNLAPDGYPYVYSSLSAALSTFYKDTDTSRFEVQVFSPLSSTDWSLTVGCPYYTLSCGVEDEYLCGLTQQHETLRKIVFTNL